MAITITTTNYETEILKASKPAVVDIYATWCGPCQQMAPHFEALSTELKDQYTFGKINVDEARELSIKLGVSSVPTLVFFKNGTVVGKEVGYLSKEALKAKITQYLG